MRPVEVPRRDVRADHGRERLESELAALLPSVDALADKVTEFHKALVSQPFPVIVTTNYDGLVEATLQALDDAPHGHVDPRILLENKAFQNLFLQKD